MLEIALNIAQHLSLGVLLHGLMEFPKVKRRFVSAKADTGPMGRQACATGADNAQDHQQESHLFHNPPRAASSATGDNRFKGCRDHNDSLSKR